MINHNFCKREEKTKGKRSTHGQLYTAISRKVVAKTVHATMAKGSKGYDQWLVPDTVAVEPTFVAFL